MNFSAHELVQLRLNHILRSDDFDFRKSITAFCASFELASSMFLKSLDPKVDPRASVPNQSSVSSFVLARIRQLKAFLAKTRTQVRECYDTQFVSASAALAHLFVDKPPSPRATPALPCVDGSVDSIMDSAPTMQPTVDQYILNTLVSEAVDEDVFRRCGTVTIALLTAANRVRDTEFQRQLWVLRDAQPYHLGLAVSLPPEPSPMSAVSTFSDASMLPPPPALTELFPTDESGQCEASRAGLIVVGASPTFDSATGVRLLEEHLQRLGQARQNGSEDSVASSVTRSDLIRRTMSVSTSGWPSRGATPLSPPLRYDFPSEDSTGKSHTTTPVRVPPSPRAPPLSGAAAAMSMSARRMSMASHLRMSPSSVSQRLFTGAAALPPAPVRASSLGNDFDHAAPYQSVITASLAASRTFIAARQDSRLPESDTTSPALSQRSGTDSDSCRPKSTLVGFSVVRRPLDDSPRVKPQEHYSDDNSSRPDSALSSSLRSSGIRLPRPPNIHSPTSSTGASSPVHGSRAAFTPPSPRRPAAHSLSMVSSPLSTLTLGSTAASPSTSVPKRRQMPPRELFATQFAECIAELRNLCNDTADDAVTPRGKTRALLRILQRMSECQGAKSMGADDLCSVLSYAILVAGISQMQGALSTQLPFTLCTQLLYMMTFVDEAAVAAEGGYVLVTVTGLVNYLMGLRWVRHPKTNQRVLIFTPEDPNGQGVFLAFEPEPVFLTAMQSLYNTPVEEPEVKPSRSVRASPVSAISNSSSTSSKPATSKDSKDKKAEKVGKSKKVKPFTLSSLMFWLSSSSSDSEAEVAVRKPSRSHRRSDGMRSDEPNKAVSEPARRSLSESLVHAEQLPKSRATRSKDGHKVGGSVVVRRQTEDTPLATEALQSQVAELPDSVAMNLQSMVNDTYFHPDVVTKTLPRLPAPKPLSIATLEAQSRQSAHRVVAAAPQADEPADTASLTTEASAESANVEQSGDIGAAISADPSKHDEAWRVRHMSKLMQ